MAERVMLTTIDNPFNPFTQFDEWFAFDLSKGYNTCNLLARIANVSTELPENLNALFFEQAMDEIVKTNVLGLYRKVDENGNPVETKPLWFE